MQVKHYCCSFCRACWCVIPVCWCIVIVHYRSVALTAPLLMVNVSHLLLSIIILCRWYTYCSIGCPCWYGYHRYIRCRVISSTRCSIGQREGMGRSYCTLRCSMQSQTLLLLSFCRACWCDSGYCWCIVMSTIVPVVSVVDPTGPVIAGDCYSERFIISSIMLLL
jgi:hypothetical protein